MPTDVEICSQALLLVGADEITSFSDETREALICQAMYDTTLKSLLEEHPWRFSLAQAQLAQLVATPLYGYNYAYQLPTDMLRLMATESAGPYQVFENKLYSNESEVYVTYQIKPDEARFPAYFVKVLVLEMAVALAFSLSEDESKASAMQALLEVAKRKARNTDSQQQPTRAVRGENHVLINVRQ